MTKQSDDLEAVRIIADTLQPFAPDERERIVRWAREKVGMAAQPAGSATAAIQMPQPKQPSGDAAANSAPASDIKTFVAVKQPSSDTHFAATVAYYYQFVATPAARKESIGKDDLVDAFRTADRKRPTKPAQVLVNAYHEGILDRAEKGQYKLNSVGENLVAMVLPGKPEGKRGAAGAKRKSGRRPAKGGRKRARK
jgi:hypothetical protein